MSDENIISTISSLILVDAVYDLNIFIKQLYSLMFICSTGYLLHFFRLAWYLETLLLMNPMRGQFVFSTHQCLISCCWHLGMDKSKEISVTRKRHDDWTGAGTAGGTELRAVSGLSAAISCQLSGHFLHLYHLSTSTFFL